MTDDAPFDDADLAAVDQKLATLDLTDREQAALVAYLLDLDVGAGSEVTGFAVGGLSFLPDMRSQVVTKFIHPDDWVALRSRYLEPDADY